jgi:hypothetical protein
MHLDESPSNTFVSKSSRFKLSSKDNPIGVCIELISARVAVALRKRGISNVWVLEGGLTAWKREGLPVTLQLSTSEEAAERFGIEIIGSKPHVTV